MDYVAFAKLLADVAAGNDGGAATSHLANTIACARASADVTALSSLPQSSKQVTPADLQRELAQLLSHADTDMVVPWVDKVPTGSGDSTGT